MTLFSMEKIVCICVFNRDGSVFYQQQLIEVVDSLELYAMVWKGYLYLEENMKGGKSSLGKSDCEGIIESVEKGVVYGYRMPLGYKIIVVTIVTATQLDAEVRILCEAIKDLVFDAIMDPFYKPFSPVTSPRFIEGLRHNVDDFNAKSDM